MADSTSQSSHLPIIETNQAAPVEPQPPAPSSLDTLAPLSSEETNQKKMGLSTESESKPGSPAFITKQPEPAIKIVRLDIPFGCDIVEVVQKFAREHQVGLHVTGGSGHICNFSLLNTSFLSSGVFDLVNLSGTFMDSTMIDTSCNSSTVGEFPFYLPTGPWLRVTFIGAERELLGGIVASSVFAASDAIVHAMTFKTCKVEVLDPNEYATMDQKLVKHEGLGGECEGSSSSSTHLSRGGFSGVGSGLLGGGGSYGIFGGGGR